MLASFSFMEETGVTLDRQPPLYTLPLPCHLITLGIEPGLPWWTAYSIQAAQTFYIPIEMLNAQKVCIVYHKNI